ncbi:hypothetical protein [Nonomuraea ceibae]|uniref:hypothetical protein n=1 Tax=Nonomuraea ceibae TaxID=1935170 RepID=UPI001C5E761B|nr:hypothetical protein [Nonomuraea ceibae]
MTIDVSPVLKHGLQIGGDPHRLALRLDAATPAPILRPGLEPEVVRQRAESWLGTCATRRSAYGSAFLA